VHCDIEFAHHEANPPDLEIDRREVRRSAELAQRMIERFGRGKLNWCTSVLIDDKRSQVTVHVRRALESIGRQLGPVPVVRAALESKLILLADDFLTNFDRRKAARIGADFSRYRMKNNQQLGCSQDISIWYALRLGILPSAALSSHLPEGSYFGFEPDQRPLTLVTIVPERQKEYELRADGEILRYMPNFEADKTLFRLYFNLQDGEDELAARVDEVADTVLARVDKVCI
jgi:hypothetical protein